MLVALAASLVTFAASIAVAADASSLRLLAGTLTITDSAGHDCLPTPSRSRALELLLDEDAATALAGFEDGHVVRWTIVDGAVVTGASGPRVSLARAVSPDGADLQVIAPGTETCRWTGTLRARDAAAQVTEHAARLRALDAVNALIAEGDALVGKGKADEALPFYERAWAQRGELLGAEHSLTLRAEIRIARALQLSGKAEAAIDRAERVLAVAQRTQGDDAFDTVRSRQAVGLMLWSAGRPQEALPLLQRSYDELAARYGTRHLETLITQGNLALTLWDLGRLAEAAKHLEFQLPSVVAIRGETHRGSLDSMNNLALIYQGLGRHTAALELLERTYRLAVASLGADHPDTLSTLQSVGVGYAFLERSEDALALYRTAHVGLRRVLGEDHPWTLIAQSNIGAALLDLQRPTEALPVVADLVPRAERAMGVTHFYTQRWINLLGSAYTLSGEPRAAIAQFERAYALQVKSVGAEHPDALETLLNLGTVKFDSGARDEGRAMLRRALDDLRRVNGPDHRVTLSAAVSLAEAAAAVGERDQAIALLNDVVAAVERLRSDEGLSREARQAFFSRWALGYKRLALLHGAHDAAEAFRVAELSKARILLESLALRGADMAGVLGADDAARLASLDERMSSIAHAIGQATGRGDELFRLESERNALVRESSSFRRELRSRYPRYAELAEVDLIDATRAAAMTSPREALVSYLVTGGEAMAFVVRRGRPLAVLALGRIEGLDRTVEAYRVLLMQSPRESKLPVWRRRDGSFVALLARPDDAVARIEDADVIGRALYRRLVQPLERSLAGTTRWVIAPDGALATLPFEVLPRYGKPLVMGVTTSYVQSLSVLALMKSRPGVSGVQRSLLAMGAPRFTDAAPSSSPAGDESASLVARLARGSVEDSVSRSYEARGVRWPPLPGAAREIDAVASLFDVQHRVVAIDEAASERNLRALNASGELATFRYLLFATHAYLDTVVPSRSAIVLSQVGLGGDTDGYVTVAKWAAYRLQSELAVLSACETGLGGQVQGEGVTGLPYAFFVAGNRSTVLTLWRIDDEATAAFVTDLFRRLRAGADNASALAAAKRAFIGGPTRTRAPALWAPFVLYGS